VSIGCPQSLKLKETKVWMGGKPSGINAIFEHSPDVSGYYKWERMGYLFLDDELRWHAMCPFKNSDVWFDNSVEEKTHIPIKMGIN